VTVVFAVAAGAGLGAFGSDVGPPAPRISSAPPRTTAARSATFAIDAAAGLTLACALDEAEFVACRSLVTYHELALGRHVFRVRARAATGPWSDDTSYAWQIVTPAGGAFLPRSLVRTLARPLLRTTPVPPYVSPRATFAWRAPPRRIWPERTTFACSLDAARWSRCASPKSYGGLRSGTHKFRVRAQLGRRHGEAGSFRWTIELSPPEQPDVTVQPPAVTGSADVSFAFGGEGASGYECSLDDGSWERCASPVTYVGLAPGRHEFCVRAVSPLGVAGPPRCVSWLQTALPTGPPQSPSSPPPSPAATFAISGDLPTLLSPGTSGTLPLTISNPNDFDMRVTDLVVSVRAGTSHAGCDGQANLAVVQSNAATGAVAVVVPARGSVTLPVQGATAPEIVMLNLPSSQDACKDAVFTLDYRGTGTRAA
jgi:hypothetical protein